MEFYEHVVVCDLCKSGILRDSHTNIPRGFFTEAKPEEGIEFMLVTQNPGQPMEDKGESRLYEALSPMQCVSTYKEFVRNCFYGDIGKAFHRRLLGWMSVLLELPPRNVFNHVLYTNLVKCTTKNNSVPNREVTANCVKNHLLPEIKYWNPKIVVALGKTTSNKLARCKIVHHYLPHPSHREHSEYHVQFLDDIKRIYKCQLTRRKLGGIFRSLCSLKMRRLQLALETTRQKVLAERRPPVSVMPQA